MNGYIKIPLFLCIAFLFSSCDPGASEEDTESPAEAINEEKFTGEAEETAEFLTELYSFNLMIRAYNDAALQQADVPGLVTEFAKESNKFHQTMNDSIQHYATNLNVTLPNMVGENVRDYVENITDEEPGEFAEEYVDVIEDIHDRMLMTLSEAEEEDEVIAPQLRVWALASLSEIEERNNAIEQLEETVDELD